MYKLITFDIYSASLDINGSAVPVVQDVLDLPMEEAAEFFQIWRTNQWTYLLLKNSIQDGYRNYYEITCGLLDYMEKRTKKAITDSQKTRLMEIWTTFKAWPEAKGILDEIRNRGYHIAMLSNGDRDMLYPLQESSGITFDYIFSGDMAGCYKPSQAIYELPYQKLKIKKAEMLHVAGSMFDVMGAKAAGCICAWTNRHGDLLLDEQYKPDYELRDLSELLDIL